ncbi:xanthine dehydrogenase molybdenum binding subunit apoprotein [Maritalea mobilis]|uniref:Xanthine dehydrogenase molybdenum binding subunit apoprotein n=1 Tax=Maritalea mobilis TaxID=483324 RepID=A0A4R6VQN1_9HYPH|nr:xanthine dehydrogenase molybdopterin binding subunit [Maritalea mobilis]TDQ61957.1 xanthine dehydrogenase molybdenum binding subunit apoprotein [Maritalea mobilis]
MSQKQSALGPKPHESAHKHVAGAADYLDDINEPAGTLHAYIGLSTIASGTIENIDFTDVLSHPNVLGVLTASDIPGENDVSPTGLHDDPIFADKEVLFLGQPVFAVIATHRDAARRAAKKAKISYQEKSAILDIRAAEKAGGEFVTAPLTLKNGDVKQAMAKAPLRLKGEMEIGGQDHFYLEGHIAMAIPGEDDTVKVISSTQHPSEVQHMVAHALGAHQHAVNVEVRRMGGGFGGKETQASLFACVAAIAAKKYKRAVKIRPDRDDDMVMTGKRHDFLATYEVGFDESGKIHALDADFAARCGFSADLSGPVTDRALFHADNCYFLENVELRSRPLKTNTVSNTAFRGFGGPQGLLGGERVIEEIAYKLGKDPLEVRRANFYGPTTGNKTPYHQIVDDNIIAQVVDELEESSDYQARRQKVLAFNKTHKNLKRGIALTPVKFGISFTATWYNQAGALVHIYKDGSILLNHGGTEMGQGLYSKVAQVLADELQVDPKRVKVSATRTDKVPNTSATAASSGTDLNGMAAADAARQLEARLVRFAADKFQIEEADVKFGYEHLDCSGKQVPFEELIAAAYMERVHLSAAGFYKTPDIHWNRETGRGTPFYYYAYGAAVSEVVIDTLTGEYFVDRVDLLHDVGNSINEAIDLGQVEGGFIQGMGWLTTEELWFSDKGELKTHAPSTYKIPLASDRPRHFITKLVTWSKNEKRTIKRSKAVGEPPFMLAVSVLEALSMAVASVDDYKTCPRLDAPATPERILMAVERLKGQR